MNSIFLLCGVELRLMPPKEVRSPLGSYMLPEKALILARIQRVSKDENGEVRSKWFTQILGTAGVDDTEALAEQVRTASRAFMSGQVENPRKDGRSNSFWRPAPYETRAPQVGQICGFGAFYDHNECIEMGGKELPLENPHRAVPYYVVWGSAGKDKNGEPRLVTKHVRMAEPGVLSASIVQDIFSEGGIEAYLERQKALLEACVDWGMLLEDILYQTVPRIPGYVLTATLDEVTPPPPKPAVPVNLEEAATKLANMGAEVKTPKPPRVDKAWEGITAKQAIQHARELQVTGSTKRLEALLLGEKATKGRKTVIAFAEKALGL
jgi:hypothetical protein